MVLYEAARGPSASDLIQILFLLQKSAPASAEWAQLMASLKRGRTLDRRKMAAHRFT
jgi:hypothetical protein